MSGGTHEDPRALRLQMEAELEEAAQDPRPLDVDSASIQRRNDIVAELLSYYEFLTGLHLPIDALKRPPKEGWDFVNAERFASLGKTDVVIDLYKHLPYISQDIEEEYQVGRNCACVDYTGGRFKKGEMLLCSPSAELDFLFFIEEHLKRPTWERLKQPEHIVLLAEKTESDGEYIMLDSRDGKVAVLLPRDPQDDVSTSEYDSLKEFLDIRKQRFRDLDLLPTRPDYIIRSCSWFSQKQVAKIQALYHKHGWPSAGFDKDSCMLEIAQLDEAL